jgi:MFS family permease
MKQPTNFSIKNFILFQKINPVIRMMIFSEIPVSYIFISSIPQLFLVQFLLGLSAAIAFPSWTAIFTRHIDKKHEGMEWGINILNRRYDFAGYKK